MRGGILGVICNDEAVGYERHAVKHAVPLRDKVLPHFWIADSCDNQLVHGGVHVGEKVNQFAVRLHGVAGVLHVTGYLHKRGIGLP